MPTSECFNRAPSHIENVAAGTYDRPLVIKGPVATTFDLRGVKIKANSSVQNPNKYPLVFDSHVYARHIRDDVIENDGCLSGELVDSYLDDVWIEWTEASDPVGIANYRVSRNGQWVANVAGYSRYFDRDMEAGKTYSYEIEAFDAFGNLSSKTAAVSIRVAE